MDLVKYQNRHNVWVKKYMSHQACTYFSKMIRSLGDHFGKRTAWSLIYFLNYAYFDIESSLLTYETPSKTQNYIPTYLSDFFVLVIREYRKDMFTLEKAERKNYYMLNPDTLAYIFHFLHITNFFLSINGVCRQGYPDL